MILIESVGQGSGLCIRYRLCIGGICVLKCRRLTCRIPVQSGSGYLA